VIGSIGTLIVFGILAIGAIVIVMFLVGLSGFTVIASDKVGIVEKWWSPKGSLKDSIIALNGEAGYQPDVLRGGIHFRTRAMYRVHIMPLVTIPQGKIGYVFARDGQALPAGQTLGRVLEGNTFEDVPAFMNSGGQRGPQRQILREGTYAFNLAQFVIITEAQTYYLPMGDAVEQQTILMMSEHLASVDGFNPVVIKGADDKTGIVTVNDGPSLPMGDIIAPPVGSGPADPGYHNNFQDPERFLEAGGFRGRQYQVLTEGTYFINRLFATVELIDKVVIPVGYAGVVVSYFGPKGTDVSGEDYRHGELVATGNRGVWNEPLMPGKYAFNTYAGSIVFVPTTNIILKWISGQTGEHQYDENLAEVSLITRDAFEPLLPLSVVIHIDYKKAPLVIQRFGDIKMLVNQTLDPMVSAYFKNIGQTKTLIELIQQRSEIQTRSGTDMREKFARYNLELEEVLIGTPHSVPGDDKIETILVQLRDRQIAVEKLETFERQKTAAAKERELKEATAVAEQQTTLTQSEINIKIQENQARAELQRAQQDAERVRTLASADADRVKTLASGDAEKVKLLAEADAARVKALGEADASKVKMLAEANAKMEAQVGIGKAIAIEEQVRAYGGPQLQLMQDVMTKLTRAIETSGVPLVPSTVVSTGGDGNGETPNAFSLLMTLLATEKLGDVANAEPIDSKEAARIAAIRTSILEAAQATEEPVAKQERPAAPAKEPRAKVVVTPPPAKADKKKAAPEPEEPPAAPEAPKA
jgi:uncharacterized membrane protein YqiK